MKAALYARVSTTEQVENGDSCNDQLRECRELAERNRFKVVGEFIDEGISGNESQRPGYQKLLADARERRFDFVIAHELSRLWRNEAEQATVLQEFDYLGVHVVTGDGIDTRLGNMSILLAVKGAMSAEEVRRTASRVHRTLKGFAIDGDSAGGRAYGITPETESPNGERVVNPDEAKWVRWIFERYADGWSPRKIAAELNEQSVPSPGAGQKRKTRRRDGKWLASTIYGDHKRGVGLLHNEIYRGWMVWNRTQSKKQPGSKKRSFFLRPENEWIRKEVPHLRIVSEELWNRVRAREDAIRKRYGDRISEAVGLGRATAGAKQSARRGQREPRYALTGLIKCASCGASYVVTGPAQTYVCSSRTNGGDAACSNRARIKRVELETWVLGGIQTELRRPEWEERFREEVRIALAEASKADSQGERARRKERLVAAEGELRNLIDLVKSGVRSDSIGAEIVKLEAEASRLKASMTSPAVAKILPRATERFREMIEALPGLVHAEPFRAREELRGVLDGVIELGSRADGSLEASIPLAPMRNALKNKENITSGSGGRI